MKIALVSLVALAALPVPGNAAFQPEADVRPGIDAMLGTWNVDLRPAPEADAYIVELKLDRDGNGELVATFYNGSEATNIATNALFDRPHVAFITTDGAGDYHTQFSLTPEGKLQGTTHAIERDFLAVWEGVRPE